MGKTVMLMSVKSFFGNSNEVVSLKQFGQPSEKRYYPNFLSFSYYLNVNENKKCLPPKQSYRLHSELQDFIKHS